MQRTLGIILSAVTLAAQPARPYSETESRELMRKAVAAIKRNDMHLRDYGFLRRAERTEYSSEGAVKSRQISVMRKHFQDGFGVTRIVERDGRPLPDDERRKQDESIQKRLAELRAMSPTEIEKRRADRPKRVQVEWFEEFPEALDFKFLGEETANSRPTLKFACTPRPGYRPKNMKSKVFEKMTGTIWIDKGETELTRAEAEMFDSVSVGFGLLGRIDKGTRFEISRRKHADGPWLTDTEHVRFAARVMLVKSLNTEIVNRYSEYRHKSALATSSVAARTASAF